MVSRRRFSTACCTPPSLTDMLQELRTTSSNCLHRSSAFKQAHAVRCSFAGGIDLLVGIMGAMTPQLCMMNVADALGTAYSHDKLFCERVGPRGRLVNISLISLQTRTIEPEFRRQTRRVQRSVPRILLMCMLSTQELVYQCNLCVNVAGVPMMGRFQQT